MQIFNSQHPRFIHPFCSHHRLEWANTCVLLGRNARIKGLNMLIKTEQNKHLSSRLEQSNYALRTSNQEKTNASLLDLKLAIAQLRVVRRHNEA